MLLLSNGCNLEGLDFEKISKDSGLNPEFVAPIANANLTVWDLVQSANKANEDLIKKDPNGLIKIIYRQNDLFRYNVKDFLTFPVMENFSSGDKVLGNILPEDVHVSRNISLKDLSDKLNGALDGVLLLNGMTLPFPPVSVSNITAEFNLDEITDFKTVTLDKGTLEISLENKLKVPVTINGSFFDTGNNTEIANFTYENIEPNEIKKITDDIAGVKLSNRLEFRLKTFETPGSVLPVNINVSDYFNITFDLTNLAISKGNLMIKNTQSLEGSSGVFSFDFPDSGVKAYSAVLKKGSLTIKSSNTSKLTGTISLALNEITKNGVGVSATIPLSGNSTTIDLTGAAINFASDVAVPYNRIPYVYSLVVNKTSGYIDYSATDVLKMDITLNNLEFKSVTGDFGKRSVQIDPGVFNLDVDMLDKIDGGFKLANPNLQLTIRNSIGMPASVALNLSATNESGQVATLQRTPPTFDIPVPANINSGVAAGVVSYNKQNSNIVDFIALPPTNGISYSGKADFNSTTPVTPQNPNFLDVDAIFGIDLAMELPLELQLNKLEFKDTTGISGKDFDKIETADLILNAKNGIPLDVDLQLLFVDTISKHQYGTSKLTKVLSAAKVDASGVITPLQSSNTFSLDQTEIQNLKKANGIVFIGTVSSPDNGATVAPILSDSKLELNVVIKSKINL
jgi:hypothetical protein